MYLLPKGHVKWLNFINWMYSQKFIFQKWISGSKAIIVAIFNFILMYLKPRRQKVFFLVCFFSSQELVWLALKRLVKKISLVKNSAKCPAFPAFVECTNFLGNLGCFGGKLGYIIALWLKWMPGLGLVILEPMPPRNKSRWKATGVCGAIIEFLILQNIWTLHLLLFFFPSAVCRTQV